MPSIKELREKRADLITQSRSLLEKHEKDETPLPAEVRASDDAIWEAVAPLDKQIKELEGDAERLRRSKEAADELKESRGRKAADDALGDKSGDKEERDDPSNPYGGKQYRDRFAGWLRGGEQPERRDGLTADSDTQAGYFIAPQAMAAELIKNVDDMVWIRGLASRETLVSAKSLGILRRTTRAATFAWGSELGTPTVDTALAYGKRALEPHYCTGEIKVSRDLMRFSTRPVEAIVREEMARDAGEVQEDAFLTGHGAQRPLGIFVASNDGISTGQDVSTDNTTTAITGDGLINAKFALKAQYRSRPNLRWVFHRSAVKMMHKFKDGEGNYMFSLGLREGEADRLLGIPLIESERSPSTFTTGLYVGILGDFSYYKIVDALDIEFQRLDELYARSNQVGFIGRLKTDGMPILEEAFVRVKLA